MVAEFRHITGPCPIGKSNPPNQHAGWFRKLRDDISHFFKCERPDLPFVICVVPPAVFRLHGQRLKSMFIQRCFTLPRPGIGLKTIGPPVHSTHRAATQRIGYAYDAARFFRLTHRESGWQTSKPRPKMPPLLITLRASHEFLANERRTSFAILRRRASASHFGRQQPLPFCRRGRPRVC